MKTGNTGDMKYGLAIDWMTSSGPPKSDVT